jgi:peptidoglycan/LPS O-acetylase OafA/YrhL
MIATKDRIFGLDILRCAAILFVLFSHTSFMLPASEESKTFMLMYFGFSGVEFFFVLSGYLVGKILLELLQKQPPSLRTARYFWIRRWFRTLPAYYLALLLYAGLYYYLYRQIIFDDHSYLLFFVFLQNFFNGPPEFFRHSWSLTVEEWFYLLLPLWIFFFHWLIKKMSVLYVIIAGIVVFTLVRVVVVIIYDPDWNLGARTITPLRMDSLMIGVLMAYLHLNYSEKWNRYSGICLAAGLIMFAGVSAWLYLDAIRTLDFENFLTKTIFFNVFSISIALCMPYLSSVRKASNRYIGYAVTHISLISYSLYLIHTLAMFIYLAICYKLDFPNTLLVKFGGSWAACIIGATLMYWFYEKPMTNLRERFRK